MALFRRRSLDTSLIRDFSAAVEESPDAGGDPARGVLTTGSGPDCAVVLTRATVAVRRAWTPYAEVPADALEVAGAPHPTPSWRWWAWQQVQGGSWAGETRRLRVRLLDGEQFELALDDPGEVPAVFAERVQSSILVEEHVRVPGGEVVVSGRRAPVAADHHGRRPPVVWHALAVGGVDLRRPEVSDRVVAATNRLAADYDFG